MSEPTQSTDPADGAHDSWLDGLTVELLTKTGHDPSNGWDALRDVAADVILSDLFEDFEANLLAGMTPAEAVRGFADPSYTGTLIAQIADEFTRQAQLAASPDGEADAAAADDDDDLGYVGDDGDELVFDDENTVPVSAGAWTVAGMQLFAVGGLVDDEGDPMNLFGGILGEMAEIVEKDGFAPDLLDIPVAGLAAVVDILMAAAGMLDGVPSEIKQPIEVKIGQLVTYFENILEAHGWAVREDIINPFADENLVPVSTADWIAAANLIGETETVLTEEMIDDGDDLEDLKEGLINMCRKMSTTLNLAVPVDGVLLAPAFGLSLVTVVLMRSVKMHRRADAPANDDMADRIIPIVERFDTVLVESGWLDRNRDGTGS